MGRWQPDARGRLAEAAFSLYAEQGYERTTGAEIAARAGMHERSFFRVFGDKREVPFYGMDAAADQLARDIANARGPETAIELAVHAVEARCTLMQEHPELALQRHRVVTSSAELRERDMAKHAELALRMSQAIQDRGTSGSSARIAAETALMAFRLSVDVWITEDQQDLPGIFRSMIDDVRAVLSDSP